MAPTFALAQIEMLESISRLKPAQDFTIILFADNNYIEGPQNRLVSAELENKIAANNFLKPITASGNTGVLPALKRAFQVLNDADANKPGLLIYLLSDGDFAGFSGGSKYTTAYGATLSGNEAVIQWLRDNNPEYAGAWVKINTILFLSQDEEAKKVMATIATENSAMGFTQSRSERQPKALATQADSDLAYIRMGLAHRQQGRYQEAIDAYKKAVTIDPKNARPCADMGFAYVQLERYPEAIAAYRQAITIEPNSAEAYCGIGFAYDRQQRYPEAIAAYEEYLRLQPIGATADLARQAIRRLRGY
jgi:tetratricopeptide (TPR) repeat protein